MIHYTRRIFLFLMLLSGLTCNLHKGHLILSSATIYACDPNGYGGGSGGGGGDGGGGGTTGGSGSGSGSQTIIGANYLTTVPNVNPQVGTTAGSFNVSSTGGACYTVPIVVPTGPGGLQPSLSISYNSQSGNGVLGMGMNLTGLSVITRAPSTIYYNNGVATPIQANATDNYAIDGARLLLCSGSAGALGAEYRTEAENFSKVNVIAANSYGPTGFEVTTKEGVIYRYGSASTGGRFVDPNNSDLVLAWYLDYVQDANGNYMTYSYSTDNNVVYLDNIKYGGNINTRVACTMTVQMKYESRTDVTDTHYISRLLLSGTTYNLKGKTAQLLSQILVQNSGSTIREYDAYYHYDLFARLIGIYEKGENGTEYKPITFNWYSQLAVSSINSSAVVLNASNVSGNVTFLSADLNGDGLDDLIALQRNTDSNGTITSNVKINTASLSGEFLNFNLTSSMQLPTIANWSSDFKMSNGIPITGDIDGSGKNKLLFTQANTNTYGTGTYTSLSLYWINSTSYTSGPQLPVFLGSESPLMGIADFNQDGKDELTLLCSTGQSGNYGLDFVDGNIVNHNQFLTLSTTPGQLFVSDINGDGLPDLCVINKGDGSNSGYSIFLNQGSSTFTPNPQISSSTFINGKDYLIRLGDFNGDGFPDFIANKAGTTNWYLGINDGNGNFTWNNISNIDIKSKSSTISDDNKFNCYVLDLDGDGKSDIVVTGANYNGSTFVSFNTKWYRSNGSGFDLVKSSSTNQDNTSNNMIAQGDFDGNGHQELYDHGSDISNGNGTCFDRIYINPGNAIGSGSLWQIINGLGVQTNITYNSLTNNSIYKKGSSSVSPVIDITPVIPVVSGVVITSNGYDATQYSYAGAQKHLTKGFLGFTSVSKYDVGQLVTSNTSRSLNTSWYVPSTVTSLTSYSNGSTASSTTTSNFTAFSNSLRYLRLPSTKTDQDIYGNNVITSYTYDGNGNILSENAAFGSGIYKQTTYSNYTTAGSYLPNKPQLVTSTWKHPDDGNTFVTQKTLAYDATHGYVTQKTENNQTPDKQVTTTYSDFDGWGNPQKVIVSPTGLTPNNETFKYDPTGRFVTLHTTPLNSMTATYDVWGHILTFTDDLNRTTTNKYDGLGRLAVTTYPDGRTTTQALSWGSNITLCYYLYCETTGKPWTKTWYDNLGRVVNTESVGTKDVGVSSSKEYNMNGQIKYINSCNGGINMSCSYNYDALGRTTFEIYNNGKIVSYIYGNHTTSTTTDGMTTTKTVDAWGNPVKVTDPAGNTVNYTYYSCGKHHTVNATSAQWSMAYDKVGNQIQIVDPDAGTNSYEYNALGQITAQSDAKNSTAITYDTYNRVHNKIRNSSETTTYTYVDSGDGKGKVQNVSGSNGYQISYGYDHYDRLTSETRLVDGVNYTFGYGYDANGNSVTTTYPTGYIVKRAYDANGFVDHVTDGSNTLWQQGSYTGTSSSSSLSNGTMTTNNQSLYDGRLQSLNSQVGSSNIRNFTYDFNQKNGNLNSRTDGVKNISDSFTYDNLYRLSAVTGNNPQAIGYDTNGNITSKSNSGNYSYGEGGGIPHAITSINSPSILIPTAEQDISYTSFGKVASITEGVNNLTINYTPDENRAKTVLLQNGTMKKTTIFDGNFESETYENNTVRQLHYIALGDGVFAVMVRNSTIGTDSLYYVHPDHLGSYTLVTDALGNVKERATYDPWGLRTITEGSLIFSRGFTGHEHLDAFNLINMNGRCYDPVLGRFLSPDPNIQDPNFSQSFNKYSYCLNNPLIYTDPSGCSWKWVKDHWVRVVDVVVVSAAVVVEAATGQEWAIVPTLNAGLNVWNNSDNIERHPGNFVTFAAIGFGTGYVGMIGGGPLVAGVQTGLNDIANQKTDNIVNDVIWSSVVSAATLALGSNLNQQYGIDKTLSYIMANVSGSYVSSSYDNQTQTFNWNLTSDKLVNMTVTGAMGGISANIQYHPQSQSQSQSQSQTPGGFLTNMIPFYLTSGSVSFVPSFTMPSFTMPSYYPGITPSPLPQPFTMPISR